MATEEGLGNAIGCLSTVFPEFLAIEVARLTDEIVSATQAITDPLAAIANANTQGLVDDAAELANGSIVDNLSSAAIGLASSYARRRIEELLTEMAKADSGVAKTISQSLAIGEKVFSSSMVMMSLFRETPYVVAQRMCEKIDSLCDLKLEQLQCLQLHVVQMSNIVTSLIVANNSIVSFSDELKKVLAEIVKARQSLQVSTFTTRDNITVVDVNALAAAADALKEAEGILSPSKSSLSVLDITSILVTGTDSGDHTTSANIKLAAMVAPHLKVLLIAEIASIDKVTDAINFYLKLLFDIMANFSSSATQSRPSEIRARTIRYLLAQVVSLEDRIGAAIDSNDAKSQTRESLLWSSQIRSMAAMADRIQSKDFTADSSEGKTKADALQDIFNRVLDSIRDIDGYDTEGGVDDIFNLKVLVLSLAKSAEHVLDRMDSGGLTDSDLVNFQVLVAQTATGGNNRIEESVLATTRLKDACESFASVQIGFRADYEKLLTLLDSLGMDRGKDLVDSGQFADYFNTGKLGISLLSYTGQAISCLTDAINGVDDAGTANEIDAFRQGLQSRRTNELLTGATNLNYGATRILDDARFKLEEFERKKDAAVGIVNKLRSLAKSLGFNVSALGTGFTDMKANLERLEVGANGRLSADLDEFAGRPKVGVPVCL